jgi:hypothetical protein
MTVCQDKERLYVQLGHNTDPRTARGLARQLEEGTEEEVDEQIRFLKRRERLGVTKTLL